MKNILKALVAISLVLCLLSLLASCGDGIFKDPSAATPQNEENEENEEREGVTIQEVGNSGSVSGNGGVLDDPRFNDSPIHPAGSR